MRPVLFVAGHVPAYRAQALARLHEREAIELALFGGRLRHGGEAATTLEPPHRRVRPHELAALAAGGRYRAVVVPTAGRLAPLAAWAGARRAHVPVILWASLWAHPRSAAHALTYLPLRRLYAGADAVVTYGPHVSEYVRARGARNVHVAAQSVDNGFWADPDVDPRSAAWPAGGGCRFLFVGREAREKGADVLLEAWRISGLAPPSNSLLLVGGAGARPTGRGVSALAAVGPAELRRLYAAADVLVVPSIPTRTFREPWGLVVNEAMNRSVAVIASDAVGAAAGGLVLDGTNGLVVPAGDSGALADALRRLAGDPRLRARLGAAGARDIGAYTPDAWAQGFSQAMESIHLSRGHC